MAIRLEWIDELFRKLDGKYPRLFKTGVSSSALFRTEEEAILNAKREWQEELHQCTGPDIEAALIRLSNEMPEFPPSAPMFAKMCREERTRLYNEQQNKNQFLKLAAPVKKVSEETLAKAQKEIEKVFVAKKAGAGWAFAVLDRVVKGEEINYTAECTAIEAIINTGNIDNIPLEYLNLDRSAFKNTKNRKPEVID